jgi:pyruvate-formate lyase-activating enzyme
MTSDILPLHDWPGYIPVSRSTLLESFPLVWLIGSRFYCPYCVNVTSASLDTALIQLPATLENSKLYDFFQTHYRGVLGLDCV